MNKNKTGKRTTQRSSEVNSLNRKQIKQMRPTTLESRFWKRHRDIEKCAHARLDRRVGQYIICCFFYFPFCCGRSSFTAREGWRSFEGANKEKVRPIKKEVHFKESYNSELWRKCTKEITLTTLWTLARLPKEVLESDGEKRSARILQGKITVARYRETREI